MVNYDNLMISVCRTTFEELNDAIKKVDKWKKVDVSKTLKTQLQFNILLVFYCCFLQFPAYDSNSLTFFSI